MSPSSLVAGMVDAMDLKSESAALIIAHRASVARPARALDSALMTAVLVPGLVLVLRTKAASSSRRLDADPFIVAQVGSAED